MMSVPPNIQSQIGEAVSVIADSDFWERWSTLMEVCCLVSGMLLPALTFD